ncbi:hypothetical protein NXV14_03000 [Bacteroides fragilis]|nr:hypothetical protein [Bacteroides fragilis]
MKKLMFAVIACAMGLSGCSSEDDCATNPEPAGDVTEIKLSAGIRGSGNPHPGIDQ